MKLTVQSLVILLATFDANALSDDFEVGPYLTSVAAARIVESCKSAVPANAERYDGALIAWQKANKSVVTQGERVLRSICEQKNLDMDACSIVGDIDKAMVEFRKKTVSQQIETCNHYVEQLEHGAVHGLALKKVYFDKKYGVEESPSGAQLAANPFAYENKIIGMVLFFEQMATATEGLFRSRNGKIVFSDIPKGLFTADNANSMGHENIVLAGRVLGNKALKTPMGGETLVPHLKFVGVQFCGDPCYQFGWHQTKGE